MPQNTFQQCRALKRRIAHIEESNDMTELTSKASVYRNVMRKKNSLFYQQNQASIQHHKECYNKLSNYQRYKLQLKRIQSTHINNNCKLIILSYSFLHFIILTKHIQWTSQCVKTVIDPKLHPLPNYIPIIQYII